nr:unnamed protein product [Digitaria exilis]
MLSGHAVTLSERSASGARLIEDVASVAGDKEADSTARVLYRASFQELMPGYLQYDTIIWAMISLLLVMAWGIGLLLLLYLPYKRYVLKRDILSRQLYVTENHIVYKVIIREASRRTQEVQGWKSRLNSGEGPSYLPPSSGFHSKVKVPDSVLLHKIEGVSQSLKNLESLLIGSSHARE